MSKVNYITPGYQGLVPFPSSAGSRIPFQSRLIASMYGTRLGMTEVAPWGTIVPTSTLHDSNCWYEIEVDTLGMPVGTELGVRWAPHSGKNVHVLRKTLTGDDKVSTSLRVEDAWLREADGENVRIECEVSYPDGQVEVGHSFDIRLVPHPGVSPLRLADLQPGDPIDPDKYPDGMRLQLDPIDHIQEYNRVGIGWQVLGYTANSITLLYDWSDVSEGEPGKAFDFLLPPEAYSGYDSAPFDVLKVATVVEIALLPLPARWFNWAWGGPGYPLP